MQKDYVHIRLQSLRSPFVNCCDSYKIYRVRHLLALYALVHAVNDIEDYWPEKPPKRHIHVLVEPPVSTASSSREQELLEEVASLRALIDKSVYGMYKFLDYEKTVTKSHDQSNVLSLKKKLFTNSAVAL
jgi:hypothetical protein